MFPNNHSFHKNIDNDTMLSALTSDTLNINTRYIEDDGIDQQKHDSFAPWLQNDPSNGDILDLILLKVIKHYRKEYVTYVKNLEMCF